MSIATAVLDKIRAELPGAEILDGLVKLGQGVSSVNMDEPYGVVFCTNGDRQENGITAELDSRLVHVTLHSFGLDRDGAEYISDGMTDALMLTPTVPDGFQGTKFRRHERREPRNDEDVPGRPLVMIVDTLEAQFLAV